MIDIGYIVCDMHDITLREGEMVGEIDGVVYKITKFIQISTPFARQMLDTLTDPKGITNKMAVVVGETYNGKGYQCAYSYDGHRFGLFEIEPC